MYSDESWMMTSRNLLREVSINQNNKIMKNVKSVTAPRTIEELQKEVAVLEAQDTATTQRVSQELRLDGISTLCADSVYNELNLKASIMENISHAMYKKEIELKQSNDINSNMYYHTAKSYADCAEMIRKSITDLIRLERYRQRISKSL